MTTATATAELRPFAALGGGDHGWLRARHHFSFADYYDPRRMGWGALRVWNDDWIAANSGFPPHPHRDMEIVTYVRTGAITHRDSLGNTGRTGAGDVQVMSAGTGVTHAEYNLEDEPTTLFQIWIETGRPGAAPSWGAKPFPREARDGRWQVLASGFGEADALPINAAARVLGATLPAGGTLGWTVEPGRLAYLVPARGSLLGDGLRVGERDGLALRPGAHHWSAADGAELVLVDVLDTGAR